MAVGAHALRMVEGIVEGGADEGSAQAGVEEAEVGHDLGGRPDGGTEVAPHPPLVDEDGGGEVFDLVHVGPGKLGEAALGEGREGLHELALGLGIDGVEEEGGLARARDPGEDDEAALGQGEAEVL